MVDSELVDTERWVSGFDGFGSVMTSFGGPFLDKNSLLDSESSSRKKETLPQCVATAPHVNMGTNARLSTTCVISMTAFLIYTSAATTVSKRLLNSSEINPLLLGQMKRTVTMLPSLDIPSLDDIPDAPTMVSISKLYPALEFSPPLSVNIAVDHINKAAIRLARVCTSILEATNEYEAFRIELKPQPNRNNEWLLSCSVSPNTWFSWMRKTDESKALITAQAYLASSPCTPVNPMTICEWYRECGKPGIKHAPHPRYAFVCKSKSTLKGGLERPCNWWINEPLYCGDFEYKRTRFITCARTAFTRDLLFLPDTGLLGSPHLNNRDAVCFPLFWEALLLAAHQLNSRGLTNLQSFPVEAFAFNFGSWESQQADDPLIQECHAHAHIKLKHEFICAVNQASILHPLRGRVQDGKDYDAQNKEELQKLLTPLMFVSLSDKINDLDVKVNGLSAKVDDLSIKFDNLSNKMDSVLEQLAKMNQNK